MTSINQEDILGSIIPEVYISKISLESSSSSLKDGEDEKLIVKIDLLMKEKLMDDIIGSWFDDRDITKYLNIKIFQSVDEDITSLLSVGSDAIDLIDPTKKISPNDIRTKIASKVLNISDEAKLDQYLKSNTNLKILNTKKDIISSKSKLNSLKVADDSDGNKIYDISFNVQFEVQTSNPKHLAYFVVTSFDIQALAKDYNLEYDSVDLEETNGKVNSEVVIDDFAVVSYSYIFYDDEGRIWTGPVHMENDVWYSRSEPSEDSVRLTRTTLSNTKIQDFRDVKEVSKYFVDMTVVENEVLSKNLTKRLTNDYIISKREENYFSDMFLARDKDGDAKFFFAIDIEKLIIDNSMFGGLIKKNKKLSQEMIKNAQIRSMRILRRRVREDESLTRMGSPYGIRPFNINEPLELVANSGEKGWKEFVKVETSKGSLREVNLVTEEENFGIRYFTGMDKDMSDVTDGVYQYLVEIEIDDSTVEFIEEQISNLTIAKVELQKYYEAGSIPEGKNPGTYDPDSNRFTKYFNQMMEQTYGNDRLASPWVSPIVVYANAIDMFSNVFTTKAKRQKIVSSLYSFVSPKTGSPNGVLTVIKMIDALISNLSKSIGVFNTTPPRKFGSNSNIDSRVALSKSARRTFKVEKYFSQIFDSEVVKNIGIDYLSRGEDETNNNDGIRVLNGDIFDKRVELETLNIFKSRDSDINISFAGKSVTSNDSIKNTEYSYLTPARIDVPRRSYVMLDGAKTKSKDLTVNPIAKNKASRNVTYMSEGKVNKAQQLVNLKANIIAQTSLETPALPLINRNTSNKTSTRASDIKSVTNSTKDSYALVGSMLNVDLKPVKVEAETNEFDFTVLKPIKIIPINEKSTECQTPDLSDEKVVTNDEPANEVEQGGALGFYQQILKVPFNSGNLKTNKRDLRKTNFQKKQAFSSTSRQAPVLSKTLDVSSLKVTDSSVAGFTRTIEGLNKVVTEEEFKLFPNQIKGIFLQGMASSVIKRERIKTTNPDTNIKNEEDTEDSFLYEMIGKVEYLSGYEKTDNAVTVKKPIWKLLTQERYDNFVGDEILCRIRQYENKALGIEKNLGMSYGIYDEYFILKPKAKKVTRQISPPIFRPGDITGRILGQVENYLPEVKFIKTQSIYDKDIKTPTRIQIIETDNKGLKSSTTYDISDRTSLVNVSNTERKQVKTRTGNVLVPIEMVADIALLDCQSRNVENEFSTNNLVSQISIVDGATSASREGGFKMGTAVNTTFFPEEKVEDCGDSGIPQFEKQVQVEISIADSTKTIKKR